MRTIATLLPMLLIALQGCSIDTNTATELVGSEAADTGEQSPWGFRVEPPGGLHVDTMWGDDPRVYIPAHAVGGPDLTIELKIAAVIDDVVESAIEIQPRYERDLDAFVADIDDELASSILDLSFGATSRVTVGGETKIMLAAFAYDLDTPGTADRIRHETSDLPSYLDLVPTESGDGFRLSVPFDSLGADYSYEADDAIAINVVIGDRPIDEIDLEPDADAEAFTGTTVIPVYYHLALAITTEGGAATTRQFRFVPGTEVSLDTGLAPVIPLDGN